MSVAIIAPGVGDPSPDFYLGHTALAITITGRSIAIWGGGASYNGPGGVYDLAAP